MILDFIQKSGEGKRENFEKILLDKLPDVLTLEQKKHKIKNVLQKIKREVKIKVNENRAWVLDKLDGI